MKTQNRIFILGFIFCLCVQGIELRATLPQGLELPREISCSIMAVEETNGKPGRHFEFEVKVTAHFDLEEVELYFTKPEEIVFDKEPEPFRGSLKAGETKYWKLKGKMTKLISFDDGTTLQPPIRLEGSYLYPYDAMRRKVSRLFETDNGIQGARNVDEALREMERMGLQGKKMKIFEAWMP